MTNQLAPSLSGHAEQAARASGVEVRELESLEELAQADRILNHIWGGDLQGAVSANLMRAFAHTGNYVAGAWKASRLAGASVGFAWGPADARRLHSHITGVVDEVQGRGVGFALKLHQRAWAARRGYRHITWTFDPLVRRNAWFNLMKLGARIEAYHPNFYGPMNDGLNGGDDADRCLVVWRVEPLGPPPEQSLPPEGSLALLSEGPGGAPVVAQLGADPQAALLCQVPFDAVELRRRDPALARQWRLALRSTMGAALDAGRVVSRITRDGYYVLERGPR